MSIEETAKSAWETIVNFWDGFLVFILKFMSISAFLGIILAHLEQLVVKKESITRVTISIIGSFIVVYFSSPIISHYFEDSKFYLVITLAFGYFIQYIIKFITNQTRINSWLLSIEKFVIEWLKKKFK